MARASPSSASGERTSVYRYRNSGVRSGPCQGRRSRRSSTVSSTTPRSSRPDWPHWTWRCASTSTAAPGRMPPTWARSSCQPPRRTTSRPSPPPIRAPRTRGSRWASSCGPTARCSPCSTLSTRSGTTTGSCSPRSSSAGPSSGASCSAPMSRWSSRSVTAKFRTGPTPTWAWPDESVLAGFLDAVVLHGLPFKLTGGLHHAVRGTHGGEPMHGLLNVLIATHEALHGAEARELAGLLARQETEVLVTAVSAIHTDDAERVRRSFRAYGCCGVLDPLTELEALGLIPTKELHP